MSVIPDDCVAVVIGDIRSRLEAEGGWVELCHLAGMSVDEIERLVEMELGIVLVSDS